MEHATALQHYLLRSFTSPMSTLTKEEGSSRLIDMDCNLTHPDLYPHAREFITRSSAEYAIDHLFVPGSTLVDSQQAIQMSREYPNQILASAGIHPYHAAQIPCTCANLVALKRLLSEPEVKALGEFGLDFSSGFPDAEEHQFPWFEQQLEMAKQFTHLPLFLHEREAHVPFVAFLTRFCRDVRETQGLLPRMLVHCFNGSCAELQTYLNMGCYIGLTGFFCRELTSSSSSSVNQEVLEVVQNIPLNRLVVETDAPVRLFLSSSSYDPPLTL